MKAVVEEFNTTRPTEERPLKGLIFQTVGAAILIIATDVGVNSVSEVASSLRMSEFLIGVTIVTLVATIQLYPSLLAQVHRYHH